MAKQLLVGVFIGIAMGTLLVSCGVGIGLFLAPWMGDPSQPEQRTPASSAYSLFQLPPAENLHGAAKAKNLKSKKDVVDLGDRLGWLESDSPLTLYDEKDLHFRPTANRYADRPRSEMTRTEDAFVSWLSSRRNISLNTAKERYIRGARAFPDGAGYQGGRYREFGELSGQAYVAFVDDSPAEIFDSYRFHQFENTLRMVSYPDRITPMDSRVASEIAKKFAPTEVIHIIDFGAGMAQTSRHIAEILRLEHGFPVALHIYDMPTIRKEIIAHLCRSHDRVPCSFHDCTPQDWVPSFPRASVIVALEVLEHLYPDQMAAFKKNLLQSLVPKGLLLTAWHDHTAEFQHVNAKMSSIKPWLLENGFTPVDVGAYQVLLSRD